MGAGTPEHSLGDKAWSAEGIIYGHAYAILNVKQYDN